MNSLNKYGFQSLKNKDEDIQLPEQIQENDVDLSTQQPIEEKKFGFKPFNSSVSPSKNTEKESYLSSGIRNVSSNIARGLESVLGTPGEFASLADYVTKPLAEYLVPISEEKKKFLPKGLPTTGDLREKTKKLTGEYLEPKNKVEKGFQEASELAGSLLGPMKFRRALGIAAGSQSAKEIAGLYGATPNQKEAAKLGTLLTLSMINPNGIKKYWGELYNKRDSLTPAGTFVNGKPLEKEARHVISEIRKGTIAPSEAKVLDQAEKVLAKVHFGQVDLNEMVAVKRSLNEVAGDPELFKRGQHLFPKLQQAVSETLSLNPNKEAVKLGKMADEAFGGFMQSQKVSRTLKKAIGDKPLQSLALSVGIEALSGNAGAVLPTIAISAVGAATVKGYELLSRINANPTLRKYYLDVIKSAAKEDVVAVQKSLRKLDQEMSKKEKSKAHKDSHNHLLQKSIQSKHMQK
jgi:hypothetical protein